MSLRDMTSASAFIFLTVIFNKRVLCDVSSLSFYHYPQPQPLPPIQFDEPSTPSNIYIPPVFQDEIIPPPLPPVPAPTYLPPGIYPPIGTPPDIFNDEEFILPPSPPSSLYQPPQLQMKILNMSCVLDNSFRSVVRVDGRSAGLPPVIDDGTEGCITSRSSGTFVIDMEGRQKMLECGVRRCTTGVSPKANMCVVVRMPTVRGLKLPEDGLVTLQCVPQDTVVSHTRHIRLGSTNNNRGRSSNRGVVASGGSQRNFDSRISVLRKSSGSNNFDQVIQPGSIVQLGEELVLKAAIQDGDGWKYSRMGPVVIRSPNSQRSITLVEDNGCRSPGIKNICPFQPRQLTPLETLLQFRAFLFQGSSSRGDDMLLSVRMLGCMHPQDCYQNGICDDTKLVPPLRVKRNTNGTSVDRNDTSNWETQFQFKVAMPQESKATSKKESSKDLLLLISIFGCCLLLLIVLFTVVFKRKNK